MNWLANLLKPLAKAMSDLSPRCREVARLQSDALDHRLPWRKRVGLRIHLLLCKWCRRYGKQIAFLRSVARRSKEEDSCLPRQGLPSEARERIKRIIEAGKE